MPELAMPPARDQIEREHLERLAAEAKADATAAWDAWGSPALLPDSRRTELKIRHENARHAAQWLAARLYNHTKETSA